MGFSAFLEEQLRELHQRVLEKHEELIAGVLEDAGRSGLLGRLHDSSRAGSKKRVPAQTVAGSQSMTHQLPNAVDSEDACSYASTSEIYDLNGQRHSLLSRGFSIDGSGRQSQFDALQHLQQLHQLPMHQAPKFPEPPELQVVPVPAAQPPVTVTVKRRSSLLQCPSQGTTSILSDLGIIPRTRRKSDFAAPSGHGREGREGREVSPNQRVAGWQPLPTPPSQDFLERVSENSVAKPDRSRRSSKILRQADMDTKHMDLQAADAGYPQDLDKAHERPKPSKASSAAGFLPNLLRFNSGLPLEGPGCEPLTDDFLYEFELLDCWKRTAKHSAKVTRFQKLVTRSSLQKLRSYTHLGFADEDQPHASCVIKPFSSKKIAWDLVIFMVVLHDGVVLPLQLLGVYLYTSELLPWVFAIVWTVDPIISSLIAFERTDGAWELRVSRTCRKYITGFFLPDAALALLGWIELCVVSQNQTFQIVRILRLSRLWRIEAIIQLISNNIRSERAVLCIGISGKILWLMVFLHFMACLWLGLGRQDGGWASAVAGNDLQQYSVSFHWALAQFHGTMELYPSTLEERIFAFSYLLLAYFLAVVFISFITSAMTRLHLITGVQAAHLRVLRWFLIDNGISRQLTARIHTNLKAALSAQQHALPETEVELLSIVSENLRMELHCEMYGPTLRNHLLFAPINAQLVKQLCHTAISMALISHGDLVFIQGEVPVEPRMIFVTEGELVYFRSNTSASIQVQSSHYASEPVLWTDWLHHGTLRVSSSRARLLLLNARKFQELALKNTSSDIDLFEYATEYVKQFNDLDEMDRHDLWWDMDASMI
mmetsp:Transcript_69897/g.166823  ORF Transcript_69897/g.166823 Transcript_69897/m.166823 type:complete len:826 (+) Transcript_69897:47-2524(+)